MANRIRDYYLGKKKFSEESSAEFVEVSSVAHRPHLSELLLTFTKLRMLSRDGSLTIRVTAADDDGPLLSVPHRPRRQGLL